MRLSRGFVIAVSTLSNVAGPVPELGSADFPGEPQNFSITSVAGNEATLSLKATPSVFDLNNSLIANSNFKPEFNIMTPLNPERPPDVYLPFMRFAEITAAEGNVFYTFTPSQDPLSPNYGQYKQAYVTSDVQITSRVLENGTLSGDVFVTARLTPISDDQINIIAAVGRRASRDLLEGLDRVAITQEYLTKIFYRESSYAGPRPSRTEIGEGKFEPAPFDLMMKHGVIAPVVKSEVGDQANPDIIYSLYPYKVATNPKDEFPSAIAPTIALNEKLLPLARQRIILLEMTNDSITDDPEHPGIKIIRAHGHVTDDPACILFGTAQTAFAAGLYLDGKLNIPFVPIKLENVVESTPGGEYACSGETFVMVNIVAPDL